MMRYSIALALSLAMLFGVPLASIATVTIKSSDHKRPLDVAPLTVAQRAALVANLAVHFRAKGKFARAAAIQARAQRMAKGTHAPVSPQASRQAPGRQAIPMIAGNIRMTAYSITTLRAHVWEGIVAGPDSAIWFVEQGSGKVGRIDANGSISEFEFVQPDHNLLEDITVGPDGALWLTSWNSPSWIGRITTTGAITQFPVAFDENSLVQQAGLTRGPDNAIWFTEPNINEIGRITLDGDVSQFEISAPRGPDGQYGFEPETIVRGSDGALWFGGKGGIGKITTDGVVQLYRSNMYAWSLIAGPDGALWFAGDSARIGRITPKGIVTEFPLPGESLPYNLVVGPDGAIWFLGCTEGPRMRGVVGRMTLSGAVTETPIAECAHGIASGLGSIWFTLTQENKIGRIVLKLP